MTIERNELLDLAGRWCDERLTSEDVQRLDTLLRDSDEAIRLFVDYVQLHGQLQWEGGGVLSSPRPAAAAAETATPAPSPGPQADSTLRAPKPVRRSARFRAAGIITVAALVAVFASRPWQWIGLAGPQLADNPGSETDTTRDSTRDSDGSADGDLPFEPIRLDNLTAQSHPDSGTVADSETPGPADDTEQPLPVPRDDADVIARIDTLLQRSWEENEVAPAAAASDEAWVRRAYLTLTGRIPTLDEVSAFVASDSPRKRTQLIDTLLADPRTSESLAVVWTNLLIGRSAPRNVDAGALYTFLEDQFRDNRPWIDTVSRLLAAEGRSDEVGETNFLLAHLNNAATPATAVVSRLFLCEQLHCMQCHDHPTASSREQEQFWELNAFFKQAKREQVQITLPDGEERSVWKLEEAERGGMTHFETRRGEQKAVLPAFDGRKLTADASERRRQALAEFLRDDSNQRVARAMVNRMWAHFFGAGFTNPIDDMGPHNPPTHPELLDTLTQAFVASNYDLRRLMRWIALSDAWQRSSVAVTDDPDLDPLKGGIPVFARVYPRHMTPEEVYESIRVAIRSVGRQRMDSSVGTAHRREWVSQFVRSLENDENEEALSFEGDVSQALLMMNGQETERALPLTIAAMLEAPDGPGRSAGDALRQLSLATVGREPTKNEDRVFRSRYRLLSQSMSQQESLAIALEDMLWAYLNSSEFVTVH